MMGFVLPVALAVLLLLVGHVEAAESRSFQDGNEVLAQCDANVSDVCIGYVEGIADAISLARSRGQTIGGWTARIPLPVTAGQMRDVAKDYLRRHPGMRQLGAAGLIAAALQETYPCPPATAPTSPMIDQGIEGKLGEARPSRTLASSARQPG